MPVPPNGRYSIAMASSLRETIQGVPRLPRPERTPRRVGERPDHLEVDDAALREAFEREEDAAAVGARLDAKHGQRAAIELVAAVVGGRLVEPVVHREVGGRERAGAERLGPLELEPARPRAHRQQLEGRAPVVGEALEPVPELARRAPVPGPADLADVELPVRPPREAVHPALEALREAERRALELAVHLLDEHALQPAVVDVAVEELP